MPRYFLGGTPLAGLEMQMQLIPSSHPPGSGRRHSHFTYSAENCDCKYCTEYKSKRRKCKPLSCVCFPERLQAGSLTFKDLTRRFIEEVGDPGFTFRVEAMLSASGSINSFFISQDHEKRFMDAISDRYLSLAYISAVFLLTSDESLYCASQKAIHSEMIYFSAVETSSLDPEVQLIFKAAKDLYEGNLHITLADLRNPRLFSDDLLRLIISAFIVRRYGLVKINKESGEDEKAHETGRRKRGRRSSGPL